MVVTKLISGLGNQLFQYAIGREVSLRRKVPLKLDVSFFGSQNLRSYKLHHYNIAAGLATEANVQALLRSTPSLYNNVSRRIERYLPKHRRRYFKEAQWWVYEPGVLNAGANVYLDGYWQHYKYFENLHPQVVEELRIEEPPQGAAQQVFNAIDSDAGSVSLHIRRGDYVTDTNANNFLGVLPLAYYNKAVAYINAHVPHPTYYIFSDDLQWAKNHLKIDAPMHLVAIENGTKDYLELEAMRRCRHNIIANSSFSWWGAFLNSHTGKIVIGPARWVLPEDVNARIQIMFPSWIKM